MARYNRHNIIKLEAKVKSIYGNDKSDPELYTAIKDLAEAILVVKGIAFNGSEADQISHNLASDLYMKINSYNFHIWHWTKYVWLRLYDYRSQYLRETRSTEIVVDDIVDLDKMRSIAYPQAEATYDGFNFSELSEVVESLPLKIKAIFDKYVRYKEGSEEYNKVWQSVMLTIMYNNGFSTGEIRLFQLDDSYYNYVRFMVTLIKKRLSVYLHKICGDELSRRQEMRELMIGYSSLLDD